MMRKLKHLLCTLCLLAAAAHAQSEHTTLAATDKEVIAQVKALGLPCMEVTTADGNDPTFDMVEPPAGCMGLSIRNNAYLPGRAVMTLQGDTLYDSGNYEKNVRGMRVRARGNTSTVYNPTYPSLKLKLEKKADLLGRAEQKYRDKNWALLNFTASISLKTQVGFRVGEMVGLGWEPAHTFVNLVLNGRYVGLYLLSETVKDGEARCPVSPSGYIVEADPYWWNTDEPVIHTEALPYSMAYTFKYPDGKEVDEAGVERIANLIHGFENALMTNGDIAEYIDIQSFATWMLAHDVLGTQDGAGSNLFVWKKDYDPAAPTATKLTMGPLWDLNSDYGTEGRWGTIHLTDFYYQRLFERKDFVRAYQAAWAELREGLYDEVMQTADSVATAVGEAVDQSRRLTTQLTDYPFMTMEENVAEVEQWFSKRIPWMDEAVAGLQYTVGVTETAADGAPVRTRVFDLNGRLRADFEVATAREAKVRAADELPAGVYVLHFLTRSGATAQSEKLVVR